MTGCVLISAQATAQSIEQLLASSDEILCLLRWPQDAAHIQQLEQLWVYLPDIELRQLLQSRPSTQLAMLPHPEGKHAQRGFGLPAKLSTTLLDYDKRSLISVDTLWCNDEIVLNKVVAGKAFSFQPGGHSSNAWQRLKTVWQQLRHLGEYKPQGFTLSTASDARLTTAAVGVVATAHVLKSNLSKRLLPENYANDGLFYALVVAPKSIFEMLRFLLVEPFRSSIRQPGFLGILRTQGLVVESNQPFEFRLDERSYLGNRLSIGVEENALQLAVESGSPLLATGVRHKEIRRVQNLPAANEAVTALSGHSLPWISHAATDDFRDLYQQLRENAQVSTSFLIFMVLSTLLASFGLYANSAPVIIGAMILAPLMAPIVSLSMAFARQDATLLSNSLSTLLTGWLLAVGCATLLSSILPLQIETAEISSRLRPTLLDLGVAIISGIASAYAYARAHAAKSLAGVAIAVALVPPLAVTGIGLGWMSPRVAFGALLLFLTNLAGIVFAASITFLLLGFAPFARARKGLLISALAVVLVSIPLAYSFVQLGRESDIVKALTELELQETAIRHVQVTSLKEPVHISFELVTSESIEQIDIADIKRQIEHHLEAEVVLEIDWVLVY